MKTQISKHAHRPWLMKTHIRFLELWEVPGTPPPQPPGMALRQIQAPSVLPQMEVVRKGLSNRGLPWALTQGGRKLKTLFLWSFVTSFSPVSLLDTKCAFTRDTWTALTDLNVSYPYAKIRRGWAAQQYEKCKNYPTKVFHLLTHQAALRTTPAFSSLHLTSSKISCTLHQIWASTWSFTTA